MKGPVYDFDRVIDRRNTDCLKFDFAAERGMPTDLLPLWVADMDFPAPEGVREEIRRLADHGIFGYTDSKHNYYEAAAGWFTRRHGWTPEESWLIKTPGVVFAMAAAVRALTEPGDPVVIQPPIYKPFYRSVQQNGRRVVENPLLLRNGRYEMDFDGLEAVLSDSGAKLMLFCSPHNPVGRIWSPQELRMLSEICRRHDVVILSDEIHCDFELGSVRHSMLLKATPELADRAILCTAPSKTFNIAGLQVSNIWIPDEAIRDRITEEIARTGYSQLNGVGLAACRAAYNTGDDWLDQCTEYLRGNLDLFRRTLADRMPELRLIEPEGTYLAWVDFSRLGLSDDALDDLIVHKAKLWLDGGRIFGQKYGQYQRFVLACPRSTLRQALAQLEGAVRQAAR